MRSAITPTIFTIRAAELPGEIWTTGWRQRRVSARVFLRPRAACASIKIRSRAAIDASLSLILGERRRTKPS